MTEQFEQWYKVYRGTGVYTPVWVYAQYEDEFNRQCVMVCFRTPPKASLTRSYLVDGPEKYVRTKREAVEECLRIHTANKAAAEAEIRRLTESIKTLQEELGHG